MPPDQLIIAVFASGKGSNFKAILDALRSGTISNARIALVISNNPGAGALALAREYDIPAVHLSRKQFSGDDEFEGELIRLLHGKTINFIVLAGYMKKLPPAVVRLYRNRIVNIHPALLPKFGGSGMYGGHVHEAVIASGEKVSGATVHLVDEEYDHGPIVLQRSVPVLPGDSAMALAARVLEIEHMLYPEAIRLFAEGKVHVDGRHVTIENNV